MKNLLILVPFIASCGGDDEEKTTVTGTYSVIFTMQENSCPVVLPERVRETVEIVSLNEDETSLRADLQYLNFSMQLALDDDTLTGVGTTTLLRNELVLLVYGTLTNSTFEGTIEVAVLGPAILIELSLQDMTASEVETYLMEHPPICTADYFFSGEKD